MLRKGREAYVVALASCAADGPHVFLTCEGTPRTAASSRNNKKPEISFAWTRARLTKQCKPDGEGIAAANERAIADYRIPMTTLLLTAPRKLTLINKSPALTVRSAI